MNKLNPLKPKSYKQKNPKNETIKHRLARATQKEILNQAFLEKFFRDEEDPEARHPMDLEE